MRKAAITDTAVINASGKGCNAAWVLRLFVGTDIASAHLHNSDQGMQEELDYSGGLAVL